MFSNVSGRRLVRAKPPDSVFFMPIFLSIDLSIHASHKDDTLKRHERHIESEGCWFEGICPHIKT